MNGLLVIDKPGGMTSRAAVNHIQNWFPRKTKIGHTGTLDPGATGVLVVCIGAATRLADLVQAMGKSYTSRFRLGATSTTDDVDGEVSQMLGAVPPTLEQVETALGSFQGLVQQVPPAFSALKLDGQRAHDLARKGMEVDLAARSVRIDAIRLLRYDWPVLDVEVDCGKGTYIRSIARDVGAKLGCGGLVQTLRRTRVGPFTAEQGLGLDADPATVKLLPMELAVSGMSRVFIDQDQARRFFRGQELRLAPRPGHCGGWITVAVMAPGMKLFAIGEDNGAGLLRPSIVFANPDA
jgi:tRNA pseudouridine55 synthase